MLRTRIKICGFTQEKDIYEAVQLGIDAIGLVFYQKSKRYVNIKRALELKKEIPAFVDLVALFVNPDEKIVKEIQDRLRPEILQFHGDDETSDFCKSFNQRYIRAFRIGANNMNTSKKIITECKKYIDAAGWLFDSYSPNYGGSGNTFSHDLIKDLNQETKGNIILSGGINIDNIQHSIEFLQPWAIDVSSGVEDSPGIKSKEKMKALIFKIMDIDRHNNL